MFETREEIRRAARKKLIQKAVKKAVDEERKRMVAVLEQYMRLPRKEGERQLFGSDRSWWRMLRVERP